MFWVIVLGGGGLFWVGGVIVFGWVGWIVFAYF